MLKIIFLFGHVVIGVALKDSYRTHYINELNPDMNGEEVRLAGWVHEVRNMGGITFILLRDHTGVVQLTAKKGVVGDKIIESMRLPKESVVMVAGMLKDNKESKKGFEIIPTKVVNLNPLSAQIPFEVTGKVPAEIDVRLNYRPIDLRRLETTAIFNIESTILRSFRDTLISEGFQEIRTPSIVKEATEGGADLFRVDYFGEEAYLAQSPQLYKQLAVIGGLDRVFIIAPAFRAEKSNTVYHLSEITQMDIEMGFAGQAEAIAILKKTVEKIISEVIRSNKEDLETLGLNLKRVPTKEVVYKDAVARLNKEGHRIEFGEDFNKEQEDTLGKLYGDMLVVKDYPTKVRAFYSMPKEGDQELCSSYDLIYRGMEVASGAERIHDPKMLEDALKKRGEDPADFASYIDAFRYGAPPHAGWSIGLERLAMKITERSNIRECSLFPRDRNRLVP